MHKVQRCYMFWWRADVKARLGNVGWGSRGKMVTGKFDFLLHTLLFCVHFSKRKKRNFSLDIKKL